MKNHCAKSRAKISVPLFVPLALVGVIGLCLFPTGLCALMPGQDKRNEAAEPVMVAIADFTGDDREQARALTETLTGDLEQTSRLQVQNSAGVQQAIADLGLPGTGVLLPAHVRKLGEQIHVSRLIAGSLQIKGDQVIVTAALKDAGTGLTMAGAGGTVTGRRSDIVSLAHALARQLYRKLTGEDLKPAGIAEKPSDADDSVLDAAKQDGLIPAKARASQVLSEQDLAGVAARAAKKLNVPTGVPTAVAQPNAPISRIHLLTALVKLVVSPSDLAAYSTTPVSELTPDADQTPKWGAPFLAAALDQKWWSASTPFQPKENATWDFARRILEGMPLGLARTQVSETYTGLIVDARGLDLKPDRNPEIFDEEGTAIYPDVRHVPGPDYVEEHGMVGYAGRPEDAARAGKHPLIVRAIKASGPGPFNVIVSKEDGLRILEANKRTKMLWKWSVSLLNGPAPAEAAAPSGRNEPDKKTVESPEKKETGS